VSHGRPVVAYALHDADGRPIARRNPGTVFYAASTIKLAVLLAAMRAVDAGDLALDDTLECPRLFRSDVAAPDFAVPPEDADPQYPADGSRAPVSWLLERMVCASSNEATNVLLDRLGLVAVDAALHACGTSAARMQRRFGDVAAAAAGLTNEVTAGDAVTLMRRVTAGDLTTPESTRFMRGLLMRQQHVRIGGAVPAGVMWGSKSGDVPGIEHDVAFVGDPSDPAAGALYLAVCTRGFLPEQGREVIVSIAAALLAGRL